MLAKDTALHLFFLVLSISEGGTGEWGITLQSMEKDEQKIKVWQFETRRTGQEEEGAGVAQKYGISPIAQISTY